MKRISKNKVEFDVIVKTVIPVQSSHEDVDKIEAYIRYFDPEAELNLVLKGKYNNDFLKYLDDAARQMKVLKLVLEVMDKNNDR